jgi:threonine/homoserine/homoserine lactone efflux protein
MSLQTLALFIPACFALNMAFGPNNLLSLTIGARHGMGMALTAAAGRLVAFTIMIAIAALGLGALLMASEMMFSLIKWVGVAYLLWIGWRLLRSKAAYEEMAIETGDRTSVKAYLRQEFFVAAGNPKAILIFTAFFPQFIEPQAYWQSFATLGAIFLVLEVVAIAAYSFIGARLKGFVRNARGLQRINRISGSMMMAFGVMLAFARRPTA